MAIAWRSTRALRRARPCFSAWNQAYNSNIGAASGSIRDGPGSTGRSYATSSQGLKPVNAYAHDLDSYNKALSALNFKRRHFLLRDVYDDMMVDGVQPGPHTFHLLLSGCMKGSRLQDSLYFFDQMRTMGVIADVVAYSLVITTCGKCKQLARAFRLGEEMEASGIAPKLETFVALLATCAMAGDVDKAFELLRKMTACGIAFNEYCYSALITAYKNKQPPLSDTFEKILEVLQKTKTLSTAEDFKARAATGEAEISSDLQEEFCCLITGEAQMRRGAFNRRMLVYHAALRACADTNDLEGLKKVHELLFQDRLVPDSFCVSQMIRGYVAAHDFDSAYDCFNKHINSGRPVNLDLYMVMIQGAMVDYKPTGMATAKQLLRQLDEKGFYLNPKLGSDLLAYASKEPDGDYSTANLIWDMMQRKKLKPTRAACIVYLEGLEGREIPANDPRLATVRATIKSSSPFTPDFQQGQRFSVPMMSMMSANRPPPRRQQQAL